MFKVLKKIIKIFMKILNLGLKNLWASNPSYSLFTIKMKIRIKPKISRCFKILRQIILNITKIFLMIYI